MLAFEKDLRSRAEQLVLASLLLDNGCARHMRGLRATDFSHDIHGQIFRAINVLIVREELADVHSVALAIQKTRTLRNVGLHAYLRMLTKVPAVPANAGYYACCLREPHTR